MEPDDIGSLKIMAAVKSSFSTSSMTQSGSMGEADISAIRKGLWMVSFFIVLTLSSLRIIGVLLKDRNSLSIEAISQGIPMISLTSAFSKIWTGSNEPLEKNSMPSLPNKALATHSPDLVSSSFDFSYSSLSHGHFLV